SIQAMRVAARLRDALGRPLELRALFEARTVRRLAQVLEAAPSVEEGLSGPITRAPAGERTRAPLSCAQEQILGVEQYLPGSTAFHMLYGLRLSGPLDVVALRAAVRDLMDRHEALRTRFRDGAAEVAWPPGGAPLPFTEAELSTSQVDEREAAIQREAQALHAAPFALAEGPLWRVRLLRLGEDAHALLVSMHHLIGDGESFGLLVRELLELYRARAQGRAPELGEAPLHAGDFARWQRQMLASGGFERSLSYWREELGGELPPLTLPMDWPRVARQAFVPVEHTFHIPEALVAGVRRLARHEDCTPFMVFTAAFQLLLHRLSGCQDIRVGTLLAGHARPELEGVAGLLVNTVILRTRVEPELSPHALLGRVREKLLAAFAHRELPFEALVERLAQERNLDRGTLFEALVTFQRMPASSASTENPRVEPLTHLRVPTQAITTCDLVLALEERPDGVEALLTYKSELWRRSSIERMVEELLRVLDEMTNGAEQPPGERTRAPGLREGRG
ncbi:MAG TPA: condensation domain-containing protein, partial [Archangium sp.]|nr:condensation domain-containing protein [Archangium sp.]